MHEENDSQDEPLVRPRLIRAMKKRPKLVDIEAREELLDALDEQMCERRKPGKVAQRVTHRGLNSAVEATQPVMENRLSQKVSSLNETALERL